MWTQRWFSIFSAILVCGFTLCFHHLSAAVREGVAELKFDDSLTRGEAEQQLTVLMPFNSQNPLSGTSAMLLSDLKQKYAGKQLTIVAISAETPEQLTEFCKNLPECPFDFYSDAEMRSPLPNSEAKLQAGRLLIVSGRGELLWTGDLVDVKNMLKRIFAGEYNTRDEIRLSALNDHLQGALRSGEPSMIVEAANRILEVRGDQLSALQAKAFALELLGKQRELLQMLDQQCQNHPDFSEAYLMRLDLGCRDAAWELELKRFTSELLAQFASDAATLNTALQILLNNGNFSVTALDCAITIEEKLAQLAAIPKNQQSAVWGNRALLAYRLGNLPKALDLQQKSITSSAFAPEQQQRRQALAYFERVAALHNADSLK